MMLEGRLADLDRVPLDELGPFACAIEPVFDGAFPFQHGPAVVAEHGETVEDRAEIDVTIAERAAAAGTLRPVGESRVDALLRRRTELGVLDVERP